MDARRSWALARARRVRPAARRVATWAIVATAAAGAVACWWPGAGRSTRAGPRYEVHAVRFATIPKFPKRSLVAGAARMDSVDIAMMFWVVRGEGRTILVDAGFYRDQFMRQWHPAGYVRPSEAIDRLGIRPDEVTDVILSHIHWDHADGADLFPRAKVWLQRDEYAYYVSDSGTPNNRTIDRDVARMLFDLNRAGRVGLVPGDSQVVLPGITVYTGGKHTFASEYVGVATRAGPVVLASDNAYLYENLERRVPIAQTLDSVSNVAAQGRMLRLAARPSLVVPGHDMQVFTRFPRHTDRVARIDEP
ncbi:MAG: N-acyl homoserine lactonase family protein [Gemmatimonadota bacterium]|nr:N-acyl homoserine lactonase family protein [Gemmatimonadota bacterium]